MGVDRRRARSRLSAGEAGCPFDASSPGILLGGSCGARPRHAGARAAAGASGAGAGRPPGQASALALRRADLTAAPRPAQVTQASGRRHRASRDREPVMTARPSTRAARTRHPSHARRAHRLARRVAGADPTDPARRRRAAGRRLRPAERPLPSGPPAPIKPKLLAASGCKCDAGGHARGVDAV
jgi:hypothetical protein